MDSRTMAITFKLNGRTVTAAVPPHWTLLQALRDALHAHEVKDGCNEGDCGACAVLVDGVAVNSCLVLAAQAEGCEITTVRGVPNDARVAPLLDAFVAGGGAQCGYCTPGMIVAAAELLLENPRPSRDEIRHRISGNLCRCTGYSKIVDSIALAARMASERGGTGA